MWLWEEYILRHNLQINPADYGFETEPVESDRDISIRVTRSEITAESLWSFFIHHHNLENWSRRECFRNGIVNSITREQQLVFRAFPYLSSVWHGWQQNTPENFRIVRRF